MRILLLGLVVWLGLAGSGCESVSTRLRERFEPVPPKVRTYAVPETAVFAAVQTAVRRIDFTLTRAAAAQGVVDGISGLQGGDSFGAARQYSIEVRLASYEPGTTEVAVLLKEAQESSSYAGATNLALREHGLYSSFFAALDSALALPAASSPVAK